MNFVNARFVMAAIFYCMTYFSELGSVECLPYFINNDLNLKKLQFYPLLRILAPDGLVSP